MLAGIVGAGFYFTDEQVKVDEPTSTIATTPPKLNDSKLKNYIAYQEGGYVYTNEPFVPTPKTLINKGLSVQARGSGKISSENLNTSLDSKKESRQSLEQSKLSLNTGESMVTGEKSEANEAQSLSCQKDTHEIFFNKDSVKILNKNKLKRVLDESYQCGYKVVKLSGHASPDGALSYNIKLAERRALSVKKFIQQNSKSFDAVVINPLKNNEEISERKVKMTFSLK